jgi:hypothetical protein
MVGSDGWISRLPPPSSPTYHLTSPPLPPPPLPSPIHPHPPPPSPLVLIHMVCKQPLFERAKFESDDDYKTDDNDDDPIDMARVNH